MSRPKNPEKMTDAEVNRAIMQRTGWRIERYPSKMRQADLYGGYAWRIKDPTGYVVHKAYASNLWDVCGAAHCATSFDATLREMKRIDNLTLNSITHIDADLYEAHVWLDDTRRNFPEVYAQGPTPARALANAVLRLLRNQRIGTEAAA